MEKIRVLHIQETIGSGGVERRRYSLAKKLNKDKFDLKIICTYIIGDLGDKIRAEGIEVIALGGLTKTFQWEQHKKVQHIIDEFRPHIIHGAVFEGVTMAAVNGFYKRVPIVIIEETSDPVNRSWKADLLMRFFGYVSDCAIGVSPVSVNYLLKKAGISKNKVKLLNNGVKIPRKINQEEINSLKIELGIGPDDLIIGSVGRMLQDEHKRFSDLIKAFAIVKKDFTSSKLILIGEGQEQSGYKALAQKLGIHDSIIFTNYQSDTALYYSIMDIFSLVSAYEAFGLVLAEAMLHKLPIVATRVGGMQYIVENEITGFLVERFNVDEIAEKITILLKSSKVRKEFGYAGYNKALQNYTEDIYVENIEGLYMDLVSKKGLN